MSNPIDLRRVAQIKEMERKNKIGTVYNIATQIFVESTSMILVNSCGDDLAKLAKLAIEAAHMFDKVASLDVNERYNNDRQNSDLQG